MELLFQRIAFVIMIIVTIILILATISCIISSFVIDVTDYTITSKNLPKEFDDFKIVQLSDLHAFSYGKDNKKITNIVNKEKPDIVVMTGDMISTNSKNYNNFYTLAKNIAKDHTTYYIMGNHELKLPFETQLNIMATLTSFGVKVLSNSYELIEHNGENIYLVGLHQPVHTYKNNFKSNNYSEFTLSQMYQIFPRNLNEHFSILLSHSPFSFDVFSKWGADLVLSGHVHGGLIRFPFIGGVLSPERSLFPKYSGGQYLMDDSSMIVSRGLGNGTINLRIFNNPEICVIKLKSE